MRRFPPDEIETFLRAVDKHLTKPFRIDVVGAAAAALSYGSVKSTMDIDTTGCVEEIRTACKKAGEETGLRIPVQHAAVFDGPYEHETRMQRVRLTGIQRLQIHVPEKHDWALMKIVRFHEKDIEDIKAAAGKSRFDFRSGSPTHGALSCVEGRLAVRPRLEPPISPHVLLGHFADPRLDLKVHPPGVRLRIRRRKIRERRDIPHLIAKAAGENTSDARHHRRPG